MAIVPLATARAHLRVDGTHDDALIADVYLAAAEQAAADYLNRSIYADADQLADAVLDGTAGTDPIVANKAIIAAILLTMGHLYANREASVVGVSVAELPQGARSLLMPHRVQMGV